MRTLCIALIGTCAMASVAAPRKVWAQTELFARVRKASTADSTRRFAEAVRLWHDVSAIDGGDPAPLYLAARSAAAAGERDTALVLLDRAIESGLVLSHPLTTDTLLAPLHGDARWRAVTKRAQTLEIHRDTALRAELLRLEALDQANRATIVATIIKYGQHSREGDSAQATLTARDAPLQSRLRAIVRKHGWPGRRLVGDDGAHAAWLLVQHADTSYQRAMLPVLQSVMKSGDVRAADVAYLEDRVRMDEGLPQRYGTQLTGAASPGALPTMWPVEDDGCVDRRRASVQLAPLADYLAGLGVHYTPPSGGCRR